MYNKEIKEMANTTFTKYMNTFSTKGTENKYTHTRIGDKDNGIYGGSYHVPDEKNEEFLKMYYEHVIVNKNMEYLTERQSGKCIALDLDFRYEKNVTERDDNDMEAIQIIIRVFSDEILKMCQFNNNEEMNIFVMQKRHINTTASTKYNKDGVHIIFGIQMAHKYQLHLREQVLQILNKFQMNRNVINSWDNIIDIAITSGVNNWQMMGSRKPNNERYQLTCCAVAIYVDGEFRLENKDNEVTFDLFKKMSVQYNGNPNLSFQQDFIHLMRREAKNPKNQKQTKTTTERVQSPNSVITCSNEEYSSYANIIDKNMLGKGVQMRASRFKFITASKNIGIDYNTVAQIMQDAPNNDEEANWTVYNQVARGDKLVGMGTIRQMARESNPEEFKKIYRTVDVDIVNQPFSTGLLADFYMSHYGKSMFIFNCEKLYFYNGVRWEISNKKLTHLHKFIDTKMYNDLLEYAQVKLSYYTKMSASCDESQADVFKDKIKKVAKLLGNINNLRCVSSRKGIVEDIITYIADDSIVFDANPYLFAFNNVIFDLETGQQIPSCPEQYVSITAGYDYDMNVDNTKAHKELTQFLETTFPNEDVRKYTTQVLATGLCGIQIENCFINTGEGGNGKSCLNSLMLNTVGGYGYKLPSSVILNDMKTGANPELANLQRSRFVVIQEPKPNAKINTSVLKEITGDKTLNARDHYSSKCKVDLALTFVIEANTPPQLDEVNDALERRIRVIPFVSKAVSRQLYDTLENKTNVCVANPYFKSDEFQFNCRQQFFDILLSEFQEFHKNKNILVDVPELCQQKASSYMKDSDKLFNWFSDIYEKNDASKENVIKLSVLFDQFKESEYHSDLSKEQKRKYNKTFFIASMEKNLFLRQNIKTRGERFNDKQLASSILVGWDIKPNE